MTMQTKIPEDVMKAAEEVYRDIYSDPVHAIACAIMTERDRCIQICDEERERRLASNYPAARIYDFAVVAAGIAKKIRSGETPPKQEA